jgi:hypothetical protein
VQSCWCQLDVPAHGPFHSAAQLQMCHFTWNGHIALLNLALLLICNSVISVIQEVTSFSAIINQHMQSVRLGVHNHSLTDVNYASFIVLHRNGKQIWQLNFWVIQTNRSYSFYQTVIRSSRSW